MRPRPAVALVAALVTAALCSCGSLGRPHPLELWFYMGANLKGEDEVARIEPIWRRAAAAGYTKVILADQRMSRPADQDERFRANCELLTHLARILHLEIVPDMFSVGRGNGAMLSIDPNLAESLPVRNARFVVHGDVATLAADPPVTLTPTPDKVEHAVRLGDGLATVQDVRGTARMTWSVKLAPFRCYHVAVQVRTMQFKGEPVVRVFGGRRRIDFTTFRMKSTQDWTEQDVMFNSLTNPEVKIVIGVVHGGRGIAQWRDWRIEEVGAVNLVRRAGAPLAIRDERTGRSLIEGRDFEPFVDPLLGNSPKSGQFDNWHQPPTLHVRGLADGTTLRVSWYHAAVVGKGQASLCLSDTAVARRLAEEAASTHALFGARTALVAIAEQRVIGWDSSCVARGRTAAQILSDHLRADAALLPGMTVCVWNDMFDPKQNAVPDYYLVNGDLTGSWEGLDSSVTVINWNGMHRAESLRFFGKRGNRQVIASYYDGNPSDVRHDLDAARGVPGVTGVMYTTWRGQYQDLEAFAEEVLRAGWR